MLIRFLTALFAQAALGFVVYAVQNAVTSGWLVVIAVIAMLGIVATANNALSIARPTPPPSDITTDSDVYGVLKTPRRATGDDIRK